MKRQGKTLLRVITIIAVLGAAGGALYASGVIGPSTVMVGSSIPTVQPMVGPFERTVNTIGELKAARSSTITAPFASKIVRMVPEGTRVQEGEPIIWLETADIEDQVRDTEAELVLAEKDLVAAEEEYRLQVLQNDYSLMSEQAKVEIAEQREADALQRFETESELVRRGISPRSRQDELQLAYLQAGVDLRNARINLKKTEENLISNLRVAQNSIDRAKLNLEAIQRRLRDYNERIDNAILTAPVTGEISYFRIWKNGALNKVAEGDTVFDRLNLVEIPDRSQMLAIVPVNELDNASVKIGQPVRITMDALPGRSFTGVVERQSFATIDASQSQGRRSAPTGNTSTGPREFEVQIRLDTSDPNFFQGMTASVSIITAQLDEALQVPLETLTLKDEEVGIYRRTLTGPEFVPVRVLMTNDRMAAIETDRIDVADALLLRNPSVSRNESRVLAFEAVRRVNRQLNREDPAQGAPRPEVSSAPGGTPGA